MTTRMATLAGAAIALLAIATPAGAVEDALTADELGLVVEVGFGGRQVPGDTMPVTIEITPTGLFEGVIEVTSTTNTIERIPVEATAGATRRFHVLSPGDSPPRISIIPSDGREPLVRRPRVEGSSVALAGVVGTVPAGFPIVADAVTGRPIVPVAIEPVWLPHGPPALASLAVLVIDADRLRDLSADATAGLAAAVTAGLDLVVTVGPDAEPGLGLPWSPVTSVTAGEAPGTAAVTVAPAASPILVGGEIVGASLLVGQGQLAVVGAHLGTPGLGRDTGFWEPLLSAGPRGRSDLARGEGGGIGDVRLPSVGLLTLFLLGYVIVVGPVTGLGLSRLRRPELAWVVVPAVTLAFSGAAFVLASASQPSVALVTRTLAWADGAGMETASLLLRAPRQGSHDVRLPGDWTVSNRGFNSSPRVTHEPGHTRVDIDLEALQAATFDARRPLEQAPPLEVTARLLDGAEQVEVAVTNTSDVTYDRLMILAGGEVLRIDEPFGPGESTTWTVAPRVMAPWENWSDIGWSLDNDDPFRRLLLGGVAGASPLSGQLHVVAHTEAGLSRAPIEANGAVADHVGTNVLVSVRPTVAGDVPAWAFDRSVRTTGWIHSGVWVDAPADEIVQRHRLPNGAPRTGTLELVDINGAFDGMVIDGVAEPLCETVEERDEDGNLISVTETCFGPEPTIEPFPDFACPPEAVSCEFDGTSFTVCFPDGSCEGGAVAQPGPEPGGPFAVDTVTVWDWSLSTWVPLEIALAPNAASRFLSPTGELRVRPGILGGEGGVLAFNLVAAT